MVLPRIVFRCDASSSIGSGHVMRCRTLARQLQIHGSDVTFICRRAPGDLISLLSQEFQVLSLPALHSCSLDKPIKLEDHSDLKFSFSELDSSQSLLVLNNTSITSINWLVVDHYGLDCLWEERMTQGLKGLTVSPRLLIIDDLANRSHNADILLDQNFHDSAAHTRYSGLLSDSCRQLLGPHYALLNPEYPLLHSSTPRRNTLNRLLVFFGSTDPSNLTSLVLKALAHPQASHLCVDVVLGAHSPHFSSVSSLISALPNATLHTFLPSLAALICRADLAIGACGSTTWERACLGLPTLAVTIAENQLPSALVLHDSGFIKLLGDFSTLNIENIQSALFPLLSDLSILKPCKALTDGWGASRLATAMLGPNGSLKLRPVRQEDEYLLFRWANDPSVRANSFSHDKISLSEHSRWFRALLFDESRFLYIAYLPDGCPIGQIRFDLSPELDHEQRRSVVLSFSLDLAARGHGLSLPLVQLGLIALTRVLGSEIIVVAEVLHTNKASNICFDRCGFILESLAPSSSSAPTVNRWIWRSE